MKLATGAVPTGRRAWIGVRRGVESLAPRGEAVWTEPAAVRKALGELLGVLPAGEVEIDVAAWSGACGGGWPAFLAPGGSFAGLLAELPAAIGSALPHGFRWGLRLPAPSALAAAIGEDSERARIKAGVQLAAFLQAFRGAPLGFVSLPLAAEEERAAAPVLRNAGLYGWKRVAIVAAPSAAAHAGIDVSLTAGLDEGFWKGGTPDAVAGDFYAVIPAGTEPRAFVEAGRRLRAWLDGS